MKTASEIRFNYNQALARASELEEIASGMKTLANKELADSMRNLSAAWQGDSATAFLGKGETLKEKVLKSARGLEETAATIRSVAKRIYNAEMAAYRLAMARKYND
ncbi:MAG: WXG100 family type VII secretion target [Lachnospiraceae bacterium]|nr:WXG100 family type VII secretion target [Lachnospiraceae bacterium]